MLILDWVLHGNDLMTRWTLSFHHHPMQLRLKHLRKGMGTKHHTIPWLKMRYRTTLRLIWSVAHPLKHLVLMNLLPSVGLRDVVPTLLCTSCFAFPIPWTCSANQPTPPPRVVYWMSLPRFVFWLRSNPNFHSIKFMNTQTPAYPFIAS